MSTSVDAEIEIPNEEYENQFFGFSPSDLCEGIQMLITDRFEEAIKKLEVHMKGIPKHVLPEHELEEGINELRNTTRKSHESILSKLKSHFLANIFKIPDNFLLPEDSEHDGQQYKLEDYDVMMKEIESMKVQMKAEKLLQFVLLEELEKIDAVKEKQTQFLREGDSTSSGSSLGDEGEKLAFVAANASQLLQSFKSLTLEANEEEDLAKRLAKMLDTETEEFVT